MNKQVLSVIIPCFNEEKTIGILLRTVLLQEEVGEVIVINDDSQDVSVKIIESINDSRITLVHNEKNRGKGYSVSRGFALATRPFVIIQDADLEYDPNEYLAILKPLLDGKADVVFGSRFLTSSSRRVLYFRHKIGNNFLTFFSNLMTNIDLTDMETCFKAMKLEVAKSILITENRFHKRRQTISGSCFYKNRIRKICSCVFSRLQKLNRMNDLVQPIFFRAKIFLFYQITCIG